MNSSSARFFKPQLLGIFVLLGISACAEPVEKLVNEDATPAVLESTAVSQAGVAEIISQAEASYAEAASQSHAWTTTRTLIDKASAALRAGDSDRARVLAKQALATADASVEQARVEALAWQTRVP